MQIFLSSFPCVSGPKSFERQSSSFICEYGGNALGLAGLARMATYVLSGVDPAESTLERETAHEVRCPSFVAQNAVELKAQERQRRTASIASEQNVDPEAGWSPEIPAVLTRKVNKRECLHAPIESHPGVSRRPIHLHAGPR
jgi:hypothetical protein